MRRALAVLTPFALAAILVACADLLGPRIEEQSTPFYYYGDRERVYLRVDPSVLMVHPVRDGDTLRVRTILRGRGVPPDSMRSYVANHYRRPQRHRWPSRLTSTARGSWSGPLRT